MQVVLALNSALFAGITFVDASIVHSPSPNLLLYPRLRKSQRDMYVCGLRITEHRGRRGKTDRR
jgi:hypothetical protein